MTSNDDKQKGDASKWPPNSLGDTKAEGFLGCVWESMSREECFKNKERWREKNGWFWKIYFSS